MFTKSKLWHFTKIKLWHLNYNELFLSEAENKLLNVENAVLVTQ